MSLIPAGPALCPLPPTLPWPLTQFILLLAPTAIFHHPAWPMSNLPPQGVFTPHFICLLHAPPGGTGSSSSISGFFPLPSLRQAACFFNLPCIPLASNQHLSNLPMVGVELQPATGFLFPNGSLLLFLLCHHRNRELW